MNHRHLLSQNWVLEPGPMNPTDKEGKSVPRDALPIAGGIPTEVHLVLMDAQQIPRNLHSGHLDSALRWIVKDVRWWDFRCTQLPRLPEGDSRSETWLLCHGLDTATEVTLGADQGEELLIGKTANMFCRYKFQLPDSDGRWSSLRIRCLNMVEFSRGEFERYPYLVPDDFTPVTNGEPHRNYVRKKQCSFSWDWGPCFLSMGIWRPIEWITLTPEYPFFLEDTQIQIYHTPENHVWTVSIACRLQVKKNTNTKIHMKLRLMDAKQTHGEQVLTEQLVVSSVEGGEQQVHGTLAVKESDIDLWWPNGMGNQPLYPLIIEFYTASDQKPSQAADGKRVQIGFRTVELIQTVDKDGQGSKFYFKINGKPMFAKGANFIPVDSFETRPDRHVYEDIITSCVEANMNMLRVWGGGVYQHDDFYELCDQHGILVWQEFMFACAMYRADKEFLDSVAMEAEQQVRRLMHHCSVVLWSGNNENEEALTTGWYEAVKKNPYLYTVDYHRLYHETIMPVVKRLDKTRAFISSSPFNGTICDEPFTERYKVDNPRMFGDTHYYNYKDDGTDSTKFPVCRFSSEYGHQSMPWFSSFKKVSESDHWHPLSPFLIQRNHHRYGQEEVLLQIGYHFQLPFDKNAQIVTEQQFSDYCLLSQLSQALCVKAQTEHYRRLMGSNYFCMGALYWQCNDIWEAPTWAGLEYTGKWKILHNYMKDVFVPVLISAVHDSAENAVHVHVSNDLQNDFKGIAKSELWSFSDNKIVWTSDAAVLAPPVQSKMIKAIPITPNMIGSNQPEDLFFVFKLFDSSQRLVSKTLLPLRKYHQMIRKGTVPALKCPEKFTRITERGFSFQLSIDKVCLFVSLELSDNCPFQGRFHPNGFFILPGEPAEIDFRLSLRSGKGSMPQQDLHRYVVVRHLNEFY